VQIAHLQDQFLVQANWLNAAAPSGHVAGMMLFTAIIVQK